MTGDTVIMDVGTSGQGNLTLISEQDSANFTSKNSSFNLGASQTQSPSPDNNIGGTISIGSGKVNSTYNSVIEQTAIQARDGGFTINVAGNTHLKGAVTESSLAAQANGNNSLTTQTLTVENIENTAKYTASQSTVGYNYNGTPQTGSDDKAGGTAGSTLSKGLSGIGVATSGEAHGTTYSAIAPADITITDNAAQTALTGQDATQTVAMLNRDTQHANGSISNPFNQQKVAEQLEFLQLANELIITPVAAQAAKWIGDAFPPDPQHPERIDIGKLLAHAGLGAAMSQLLGTGWQTGASAGALGDILPQVLAQAFEKDDKGQIKDPEAFKAANAIISAALASATGGDLAQTINSAMITQNAVGNNYLKHEEWDAFIAKLKAAKTPQEIQALVNTYKALDEKNSQELKQMVVMLELKDAKTSEDVQNIADKYASYNLGDISALQIKTQHATPQQLLNAYLDIQSASLYGNSKDLNQYLGNDKYGELLGVLQNKTAGDDIVAFMALRDQLADAGDIKGLEQLATSRFGGAIWLPKASGVYLGTLPTNSVPQGNASFKLTPADLEYIKSLESRAYSPLKVNIDPVRAASDAAALINANMPFNNTGLSQAARAWDKHDTTRLGGTYEPISGNVTTKNQLAEKFVLDTLSNPDTTIKNLPGGGTEYRLPNGQGFRFDTNGKFGLLDPKK